jgi:hypothetical protein
MLLSLKRLASIGALAGTLAAGGCHDAYIARRDGVTFQAGDAVAANKAVHIIDPWPASAASAVLPTRGAQAAAAIERLDARQAQGQGAGQGAGPAAPGASAQAPAASAAAR